MLWWINCVLALVSKVAFLFDVSSPWVGLVCVFYKTICSGLEFGDQNARAHFVFIYDSSLFQPCVAAGELPIKEPSNAVT